MQGWDVTLTADGPLLIEMEGNGGHPQMVQLAQGEGLYQGRFKAFFDACQKAAETEKAAKKSKRRAKKAA